MRTKIRKHQISLTSYSLWAVRTIDQGRYWKVLCWKPIKSFIILPKMERQSELAFWSRMLDFFQKTNPFTLFLQKSLQTMPDDMIHSVSGVTTNWRQIRSGNYISTKGILKDSQWISYAIDEIISLVQELLTTKDFVDNCKLFPNPKRCFKEIKPIFPRAGSKSNSFTA